jgi:hypothetical protein
MLEKTQSTRNIMTKNVQRIIQFARQVERHLVKLQKQQIPHTDAIEDQFDRLQTGQIFDAFGRAVTGKAVIWRNR